MNDLHAPANHLLTEDAPTDPNGTPLGVEAPLAPAGGPLPDVGEPGPPSAAMTTEVEALAARGEPDTLPPTWCKHCEAEVKPVGKGRCPRCQTFLRLNFSRRTHPVNVLRREHLLKKLIADYRPSTTLLHSSCEMLAGILEQLETLKPGSPDHQRLVQLSQLLGGALEESRKSRVASLTTDYAALDDDALIDKLTGMLRHLLNLRDHRYVAPPPSDVRDGNVDDVLVDEELERLTDAAVERTRAAVRCEYGCGSLPRCADIKATRLEAWRALHWSDPEEIRRRAQHETDQREAYRRGWPLPSMISSDSPVTDEERQQQEVRRKLGWETPDGGTRRR